MTDLRSQLERLLASAGRELEPLGSSALAIYGAGGCGRRVAREAREQGLQVSAFIDARASAENSAVDGIRLLAPNSGGAKALADAGVPIVLAIFNYATDVEPIRAQLMANGFAHVLTYPEFHERFGGDRDFWLTKREFYRTHVAEILAGFDLLADERSCQTYFECLSYRLNIDRLALREPDLSNHYLPQDLPPPILPMRLIDGGAFTGDTLQSFLARDVKLAALAAFEPDLQNYCQLRSAVEGARAQLRESIVVPCGVGERTEMLSFSSGGGASSSLAQNGTTHVQVVALDDVLPDFAPTFIKLDIEGAEPAALRGAAGLIARDAPRLAVCVYHAPEHLWTIPLLIRGLQPAYKIALRYHQWNGFDMVAYAYLP